MTFRPFPTATWFDAAIKRYMPRCHLYDQGGNMNEEQDPTLAGATPTADVSQFKREAEERKGASTGEQVSDVLESEPGLAVEGKLANEASEDG
jgi:hypothetical protein